MRKLISASNKEGEARGMTCAKFVLRLQCDLEIGVAQTGAAIVLWKQTHTADRRPGHSRLSRRACDSENHQAPKKSRQNLSAPCRCFGMGNGVVVLRPVSTCVE